MAMSRKYKVAGKAGSTNTSKANPPSSQRTRLPDKKTNKNKDEKIQEGEKNHEAAADGANVTKKDGSGYRSRENPYNIAFRKVMVNWISVNFPEDVRSKTESSELGKGNAGEQAREPTLVQYIGWLDSLENRDEASAKNTPTKMYWQRFCEQTQNKKMVNSWMEFASNARTADGLLKFQPAFDHVGSGTSPGRRVYLHPLISFPSAGEFREKKNAALDRQVDADYGVDGSKDDEAVIEPPTAAADKEKPAATRKRSRQSTARSKLHGFNGSKGDDADSSDAASHLAKRRRNQKTARPSSSPSRGRKKNIGRDGD